MTFDAWCSIQKVASITTIESENIKFKRSIYFTKDLDVGDLVESNCVKIVRPGYGISPKYINQIIGRSSKSVLAMVIEHHGIASQTDKEVIKKSKSVKKFCWHKFFRMTKILHNLIIFILIACLSKSKIYECRFD